LLKLFIGKTYHVITHKPIYKPTNIVINIDEQRHANKSRLTKTHKKQTLNRVQLNIKVGQYKNKILLNILNEYQISDLVGLHLHSTRKHPKDKRVKLFKNRLD